MLGNLLIGGVLEGGVMRCGRGCVIRCVIGYKWVCDKMCYRV